MLIGYEANNALRNPHELGDYCRDLISRLASHHSTTYRALLFSTRIKETYRTEYTSFANVSTYVPTGISTMLPSMWMRYGLNEWLITEKVKLFHGLNGELPYRISNNIKTLITCYGIENHHRTSMMDSLMWRRRLKYSFRRADAIVAISDEVKQQLVAKGVDENKITVIPGMKVTDEVVERYWDLYTDLYNSL